MLPVKAGSSKTFECLELYMADCYTMNSKTVYESVKKFNRTYIMQTKT